MQKNFTQLIAHFMSAKRYTVPAGALLLFIITAIYIQAAVGISITGAASYSLSADLAATTTFSPITNVVVSESAAGEFAAKSSYKIVLTAPTGWIFPNSGVSISRNTEGEVVLNTTPSYVTDAAGVRRIEFTFTTTQGNQSSIDQITISGLQTKSTNGVIDPTQPKQINVQVLNTTTTSPTTVVSANPISLSQTPGAVKSLTYTQQPSTVEVGAAIIPAPQVVVKDQFGNAATNATGNISLALTGTPSSALITSGGTATLTNGVAQFNDVRIDEGGNFQLVATYSSTVQGTSSAFAVNNKVPTVSEALPCITVGSSVNTITVVGTNFVRGSVVRVNNDDATTTDDRPTTFINSETLSATLTSADIGTAQTLSLTVFNPAPAGGLSNAVNYTIHPVYNVGAITGDATVCENTQNVTYSVEDIGAETYSWTVGAGATYIQSEIGNSITVNFGSSASTVNISVEAINACGVRGASSALDVTVTPYPVGINAGADRNICSGTQTTLGSGDPAVTGYVYEWSPADGTSPASALSATNVPNPTLTLPANTSSLTQFYTYQLTVKSSSNTDCQVVDQVLVGVYPEIVTIADDLAPICVGEDIVLRATGDDNFTYSWTGPNGFTSSERFPVIQSATEANAGTYTVKVTNLNGCVGTDETTVTVNPLPSVSVTPTGPTEFCQGSSVVLVTEATPTSDIFTYEWFKVGTSTSISAVKDYEATTSGDYYVVVTNQNGCTKSSSTVTVVVGTPTEASVTVTGATTFCEGGYVTLSASQAPSGQTYTYQWLKGGVKIEGATNRIYEARESGSYQVIVSNGLCEKTSSEVVVTVLPQPTAQITGGNQTICRDPDGTTSFFLEGVYAGGTPSWRSNKEGFVITRLGEETDPATGVTTSKVRVDVAATSAAQSATITFRSSNSAAACTTASATVDLAINPIPETTITTNRSTTLCRGESVTLTANPATGIYLWSTGATSRSITVTEAGSYTVTVTNSYNCSITSAPTEVIVNELPVVSITTALNAAYCTSEPAITLEGSPANGTFSILNGTTVVNANATTFDPGALGAGTYTIKYSYTDGNSCTNTATKTVVVNTTPTVNTVTSRTHCNGDAGTAISLSGPVSGATYAWTSDANVGFGTSGTGDIPAYTATNTGTTAVVATVTVTPSANNCTGPAEKFTVTVRPTPTVNAVTSRTHCNGDAGTAISFSGSVSGATYTWTSDANVGFGTSGTGDIPAYTATNTGTTAVVATVTVTPSANNCTGPAEKFTVTVKPTPQLSSTLAPPAVCSGSSFTYTPTSATSDASFTWTRAAVTGISNAAVTNGTGGVNEVLVNTTSNAIDVTYRYTTTAFNCTGPTQNVTVSVSPNLPVAFTGTIATTNTFYTGQSAVALSAEPTGGVFSSPTSGAVTLSDGVYYFNPCAAKAGTHTITYTRTTGSCTSTVSKTVTVIQSTYRVIITAKPHPFCQGENVNYEAFVYRDANIVYPYLVNEKGEPVDASGALIPKGSGNFPVWNPSYPFPAEASQLVKEQGFRYFQPIVTGGERIDPSKFTYQWQKNETQNRKNDLVTTTDAGLSSQDYYNVKVSGTLCDAVLTDQVSYRMYSADLPDYEVSLAVSPNPMCTSGPVALTATLDGDFKYWGGIGLNLQFILTRGNTTYSLGTLPYDASSENPNIIKLNYDPAGTSVGSFINGDKIHVNFTSDVDKYVGGKCAGKTVSNTVEIKVHQPAVITSTLPTPVEKCEAGSVTYSITATGTDLRYAWYKVGSTTPLANTSGKISGATSNAITISNLALADAGNYYVVVSNGTNSVCTASVKSNEATLVVNPLTRITVQPQPQTVCVGQPASFSVTATGTSLTYQWLKGGNVITGATASTYTIPAVTTADAGNYSVRVSGTCGTLTSDAVALTVDTPPSISAQPQPLAVCAGTGATFSVTASGTGIGYQWLKNGVEISGATESSYTIPSTTEVDEALYSVRITGTSVCGTITSENAALTVNPMLTATGELEIRNSNGIISDTNPIMPDSSITVTALLSLPSERASYVWYIGDETGGTWGSPIPTGTNNVLTIESVQPGEFNVKVEIKPANDGELCYNDLTLVTEQPLVPLPVEIIYLTASKQGNDVLLEWATAMEKDNKGFEVQVSKDGLNYRLLTFVPSKNGNSNGKQVYAFTDKENGKEGTRYYRLKQIDNAGTFEFFGPKMVTFGSVASKVIAFPNPFNDEITLDIASETDGEMLIVVNDAVGKQLMQRKVRVEKGFTTEKLKLGADLPRGLYIIKTQIGGYTQFIKMIKE